MACKRILCESLAVFLYIVFGAIGIVGMVAGVVIPSLAIGIIVPILALISIFFCKLATNTYCLSNKENVHRDSIRGQTDIEINDGYTELPLAPVSQAMPSTDEIDNETGLRLAPPEMRDAEIKDEGYVLMTCARNTIPFKDLLFGHTIGEGAYGKVVLAKITTLTQSGDEIQVAVKMLKDKHNDVQAKDLRREFEIMRSVGCHKNIINLLGCSFDAKNQLMIIMDYACHGSLRKYLQTQDNLTEDDLTMFALQVASGMQHLASKQCVHRDLAARNVLVTEDRTMKVSDFGLAREVHEEGFHLNNKERGLVPYKWMAPEYLTYQVFGSNSDVWSFGVLLWEVFSGAADPYPNVNVASLKQMLENGERLAKPENCPDDMYKLMCNCWNYVAARRPTFEDIVISLKKST